MQHDHLLIFDLDDTLIDTSDIYWKARTLFVQELTYLGYEEDIIIEAFETIDANHISTFGFSPSRYRKSMIMAYKVFQRREGLPPSRKILKNIKSYGNLIFNSVPQLIEGAEELLTWAVTRYTVVLITRGDLELQKRKLRLTGLSKFFSAMEVVPDKNADTFTKVIRDAGYTPSQSWVIGDSIRTDINPGICAGATCILYAYQHKAYHWRQEHGQPAVGHFYYAKQLSQVMNILKFPSSFRMVLEV